MRRELYPAFTDDPMIRDTHQYSICQDCVAIGAQLKAVRPELGDVYLSLDDLKDLIGVSEPNRNHERDFNAGAAVAVQNLPIVEAATAFREHEALAGSVVTHYQIGQREMKSDVARFYAAIVVERERKWHEGKLYPFIDWLIAEGIRLRQRRNGTV
jgi:hypothetical protein